VKRPIKRGILFAPGHVEASPADRARFRAQPREENTWAGNGEVRGKTRSAWRHQPTQKAADRWSEESPLSVTPTAPTVVLLTHLSAPLFRCFQECTRPRLSLLIVKRETLKKRAGRPRESQKIRRVPLCDRWVYL